MPLTATSVTPDSVDVTAEPATADPTKPKDLDPSTPKALPGVSAEMTPTVAAGVFLAQFVLWITSGSIAAFIIYLAIMDFTISSDVNAVYQQVYSVGAVGAEFHDVRSIDLIVSELKKAEIDQNFQMTTEGMQSVHEIATAIAQLPSVPLAQRSVLNECAPPPTDKTRAEIVGRCLDLIDRVRSGIIAQSSSVAHSQAAADAVSKIGDQRQSLHTFWVQAAQLVLLNLLLPLLTALFGYIFGTQQSLKSNG